jgi:hypothetical protein
MSPMIGNVLLIGLVFVSIGALYRWGGAILAWLRRIDARNARRQEEQYWERFDPNTHYRHTLRLAEEQVEEITEISVGAPAMKRYLFGGKEYRIREEAEEARKAAIIDMAREYYRELDTIYLGRRGR